MCVCVWLLKPGLTATVFSDGLDALSLDPRRAGKVMSTS